MCKYIFRWKVTNFFCVVSYFQKPLGIVVLWYKIQSALTHKLNSYTEAKCGNEAASGFPSAGLSLL